MNTEIIETWRNLNEKDRLTANGFNTHHPNQYQEGFIRKIRETELFYIRSKTVCGISTEDLTASSLSKQIFSYFLIYNPDMPKPINFTNMVYGKIAEQTFMYELTQGLWLDQFKKGEMPDYLDFYKQMLEDKEFFHYFNNIPSTNQFYKEELSTLSKLISLEEKINKGIISIEELESLLAPQKFEIVASGYNSEIDNEKMFSSTKTKRIK